MQPPPPPHVESCFFAFASFSYWPCDAVIAGQSHRWSVGRSWGRVKSLEFSNCSHLRVSSRLGYPVQTRRSLVTGKPHDLLPLQALVALTRKPFPKLALL